MEGVNHPESIFRHRECQHMPQRNSFYSVRCGSIANALVNALNALVNALVNASFQHQDMPRSLNFGFSSRMLVLVPSPPLRRQTGRTPGHFGNGRSV